MKVSRFSRNKNRTNDRKDSTKQAKHLILNAVPQIRTKKKVIATTITISFNDYNN